MVRESEVTEATSKEEAIEANKAHVADRFPSAEEESAAEDLPEELVEASRGAGMHFEEMAKAGANIRGEGEIK